MRHTAHLAELSYAYACGYNARNAGMSILEIPHNIKTSHDLIEMWQARYWDRDTTSLAVYIPLETIKEQYGKAAKHRPGKGQSGNG